MTNLILIADESLKKLRIFYYRRLDNISQIHEPVKVSGHHCFLILLNFRWIQFVYKYEIIFSRWIS